MANDELSTAAGAVPFAGRADGVGPEQNTARNASAVSWGAIFAGAAVAAAASLILLVLGTGLGLSAISPWAHRGVQASTFGISSIAWVVVTQLCASALGGYLAGRLRTKWVSVHTDEVYFRDTAHGLIAWAVASLITASILLSAVASAAGSAVQATATLAAGVTAAGATTAVANASDSGMGAGDGGRGSRDGTGPMGYLVDSLFRKDPSATAGSDAAIVDPMRGVVPEVTRIFVNSAGAAALPPQDVHYIGQVVAQRTGLSQADAERRVTDTYASLQTSITNVKNAAAEAADKARKAGIQAALWLFISLLAGAFVACYAATRGGLQRDI